VRVHEKAHALNTYEKRYCYFYLCSVKTTEGNSLRLILMD
jgi:hypothetical protein